MSLRDFDRGKIIQIVKDSICELYEAHSIILNNKLKEECINFHFANIIWKKIKGHFSLPSNIFVDIEYDKNKTDPKMQDGKHIRPDIIIHERNSNNKNLFAFEIKKTYCSQHDKDKMTEIINDKYNYFFSFCISLNIEHKKPNFIIYQKRKKEKKIAVFLKKMSD